ncbi:MAG: transposase [Pirellulaceae bacterium]|nr:transposase [Pirellulaceae bacterium]
MFLSGRQHAGENLRDVLSHRAETLTAPIQMCDALSRNLPADLKTIVAHCLAHGRRQFVDVAESFPDECRYVLESLAVVYRNDATAREQKMSSSARRHFHQINSGPVMSLIHICELCVANPFDYLTELERHADELTANPRDWMPWNYRATLAGPAASSVAG